MKFEFNITDIATKPISRDELHKSLITAVAARHNGELVVGTTSYQPVKASARRDNPKRLMLSPLFSLSNIDIDELEGVEKLVSLAVSFSGHCERKIEEICREEGENPIEDTTEIDLTQGKETFGLVQILSKLNRLRSIMKIDSLAMAMSIGDARDDLTGETLAKVGEGAYSEVSPGFACQLSIGGHDLVERFAEPAEATFAIGIGCSPQLPPDQMGTAAWVL